MRLQKAPYNATVLKTEAKTPPTGLHLTNISWQQALTVCWQNHLLFPKDRSL